MKRIKILSFLILFLCLLFPIVSFAKDTDIYMGSGEGVQANILIIIDNSASMEMDSIATRQYDKTVDYTPETYVHDSFYKLSGGSWVLTTIPAGCTDTLNTLAEYNVAVGYYTALSTTPPYKCNQQRTTVRTGNYMNYMNSGGDKTRKKIDVAKDVINHELIDAAGDVKIGVMVFNSNVYDGSPHSKDGHVWDGNNAHGGSILNYNGNRAYVKSLNTPETHVVTGLESTYRENLKVYIDSIVADSFTPLAETLYEASLYFKGAESYFNDDISYSNLSPIEFSCQKNYVIIMTDGNPTRDDGYSPYDNSADDPVEPTDPTSYDYTHPKEHNHILKRVVGDLDGDRHDPGGIQEYIYDQISDTITGQDWFGTDYLDDLAKYLHNTDLRSDLTGMQNLTIYTIGFKVDSQHSLLQRTADADHGGGKYYMANDAGELANAFQLIVSEIMEQTSSFVAPIVPVSKMERGTAGDKLYLALFQPSNQSMWSGNIKKFVIAQPEGYLSDCPYNPDFAIGEILDATCTNALITEGENKGAISDSSTSLWITVSPDGSNVEKGGVGGVLKNQSTRKIYTFFKSDTLLTAISNKFDTNISPDLFGLGGDTDARDKLVNFIYGQDSYDEDVDIDTTEQRDWILGSFLHSRPLVIHYGITAAKPSVIFAGGNDGMLHAFDDTTGEELWGFVPPDQLIRLQALSVKTTTDKPFVDGSPKAYVTYEYNLDGSIKSVIEAILIFGERRGGNRYYALDVTDPVFPKFLWYISPEERVYVRTSDKAIITEASTTYNQLGQSWSSPVIGKIVCHEANPHAIPVGDKWVKWVAFIGGGYDTNQDNNPLPAADTTGRAVYVIDIKDGSLVKAFVHDTGDYSSMDYCIPSDVAKLDVDGNGYVDRLYVGDVGGQMWRFNIGATDPVDWNGRIIFQSNPGKDTSTGRKIFYPPDVTLEKGDYEVLLFGTGDRENPQDESVSNRLYSLKDKNLTGTILNENDLYDVTSNELQTTTDPTRRSEILSSLNTAYGWWITLGTGEKSLASPIVFYRGAYFTTFTPIATGNPCQARFGTARMYTVNYSNGMAVLNLDESPDNVISTTDRSKIIGTAIPSGVIITFIGGTAVAYTGVGGGVDSPKLTTTKSIFPMTWRVVF